MSLASSNYEAPGSELGFGTKDNFASWIIDMKQLVGLADEFVAKSILLYWGLPDPECKRFSTH